MKGPSMNRLFLLIPLLALTVSACKSRKNRVETPVVVNPGTDSITKMASAQDLLGFTMKDWTYFSSKIDVDFKNGDDSKNVTVNIRMLKDSLVWLSAGLFGLEGARVLINKDSMVILNKLNRNYMVYKNEAIAGFSDVPLTVTQIQNLILAKPVYALNLYQVLVNNNTALGIEYKQDKFITTHRYQKQFYTIDTTTVNDRTSMNYAMARYQEYAVIDGHNFPYKTFITASTGNKLVSIDMKFEDADFHSALTFPFSIPSSYEKIR